MADSIVKSTCRGCHGVCGVRLHLRDGKLVKVTGDPESPLSRGYICIKGRVAPELLYHPDRLKYPLKRVGERGENRWQRINWDEALYTITEKLLSVKRDFGVESIVGARGTGRPYYVLFHRFLNCLGTPNRLGFAHTCYGPRLTVSAMTCGTLPVCDYYGFGGVYPECVLVWGSNLTEVGAADGMCASQLALTLKRGAKLIVVDPRRTALAARADHWLRVRPGTDAALALGMLHTIIEEDLYDKDFVRDWTNGFDKLKERVEKYTPERAAEITWVPAEAIRVAARLYAAAKPACIQWGVGIDQNVNNFQTARAVLMLSGVTGNIDAPGGDAIWVPPANVVAQSPRLNPGIEMPEMLSPEMRARRIGGGRYPLASTIQPNEFIATVLSGKPYPVRALFIMGSNLLIGHSDSPMMEQALRNIDFTAAVDLFMTPTTQLADIVLPAASWLETDDVADLHFAWCVTVRQKVSTVGECRDDKQIIFDLAHRLGLDGFPWRTVREYCDWVLKDAGITFDEFREMGIIQGEMRYRKYENEGFRTPSGKFEIYSEALEQMGFDPLPDHVEPSESPYATPELAGEYPLIASTGARVQEYFHSEGRQLKSLRRRHPDPLVEIHPETAARLAIRDGDWVWIESPRGGRIRQRARLTDGIHPSVVCAEHGWWFPEKEPWDYGYRESNVNMLTSGLPRDPHTGAEPWRSFLCKISPCKP
ncbi:MAG: molybdopterin-dependent oxidoreductase [Chloroflexota bacterium]